jgi:hypothetical protein
VASPQVLPSTAHGERDDSMSTFAEKLAAKAAARPTIDVPILLAAELVAEKERLEAIIEAGDSDPRLGAVSPVVEAQAALDALEASAGDSLITLRFTQLPGFEWAAITSKLPPRPGVPIDESIGYNYDKATIHAAGFADAAGRAYGVRLEDDAELPLSADEWSALFDALSGYEVSQIRNAVWGLNEYLPKQQVTAMGKLFGATARSEKN